MQKLEESQATLTTHMSSMKLQGKSLANKHHISQSIGLINIDSHSTLSPKQWQKEKRAKEYEQDTKRQIID
jgi:hypothetical protein